MVKHDIDYSYFRQQRLKLISDWAPPLALLIGSFGLYIKTMAQSVFWGNQVAFATGNSLLGPESPGISPLYTFMITLVGYIPGFSQVFLSNLFSAFFSSISVMIFYLIVKRLSDVKVYQKSLKDLPGYRKLAEINPNLEESRKPINVDAISKSALTTIPSMLAAILYALTLPVWMAAVHAGIYSLYLALTLAAIFFSIEGIRGDNIKLGLLGIWIYALSYTCHPVLAIALAPAFLYFVFRLISVAGNGVRTLVASALLFMVSFSVYFYLPIQLSLEAVQSSGANDSQAVLFGGLSMFSDLTAAPEFSMAGEYLVRLKKLTFFLTGEIGWIALGLFLVGFWGTFKASRRIFPFFPLAIMGYLVLMLLLGRFDIRNYEMLCYPAVMLGLIIIVMTIGLLYLMRLKLQAAPSSIYVALCLCPLIYKAAMDNINRANLSEFNAPEFMSEEILKSIPDGSALIVDSETLLRPLLHYARVEGAKPNLSIMSAEAMHNPNYRKQLTEIYPHLIFPDGFDSPNEWRPEKEIKEFCQLNTPRRDLYVQFGIPGIYASDVQPTGVIFKCTNNSNRLNGDLYAYGRHLKMAERLINRNHYDPTTVKLLGRWLFNTGQYYQQLGHDNTAWKLYDRALTIDQSSTEIRVLLADELARSGRYRRALKLISDALEIDSDDPAIMELGSRLARELEEKGEIATADNDF